MKSNSPSFSKGEERFTIETAAILIAPQKGINIIRMSDGTSKKLLVK